MGVFKGMHKNSPMKAIKSSQEVMDGSDIMELVENDKVFTNFVDHKFQQLDADRDGKLSTNELQPAVNDLGAALGLPAHGSSPESDHIYSEVQPSPSPSPFSHFPHFNFTVPTLILEMCVFRFFLCCVINV